MVINGALVGDLDMMYIESVLQEELSLSLMIRSCRADPPDVTCLLRTTDDLIDSLVCPPPPSDQLITDDALSNLIVPAPSWRKHGIRWHCPYSIIIHSILALLPCCGNFGSSYLIN